MRIHKNQTISNVPILLIRDFLKKCLNYEFSEKALISSLEIEEQHGKELLQDLIQQGYVTPISMPDTYEITDQGNALTLARCVTPLTRKKEKKF